MKSIDISSWFPSHLIVSHPSNKILQLILVHTEIFHPFHLIFLIAIHFYWGGRQYLLSWQWVICDGVQQRNMMHRMNPLSSR
jgi:hypothetical protein